MSEATALPIGPQPLPKTRIVLRLRIIHLILNIALTQNALSRNFQTPNVLNSVTRLGHFECSCLQKFVANVAQLFSDSVCSF